MSTLLATGSMVLQSMYMPPRCACAKSPLAPKNVPSTCGVDGSMVITVSQLRATSATEPATEAPASLAASRLNGQRAHNHFDYEGNDYGWPQLRQLRGGHAS